jgi:hypothetical protein
MSSAVVVATYRALRRLALRFDSNAALKLLLHRRSLESTASHAGRHAVLDAAVGPRSLYYTPGVSIVAAVRRAFREPPSRVRCSDWPRPRCPAGVVGQPW